MAETTCAVFEPTEAEFSNFRAYIEGIERNYPGIGICKIIPPATWFVQNYDVSKMNFVVKHPLQQQAVGRNGMYSLKLVETKPKNIQKFHEYAQTTEFHHDNFHIRERKFWQCLGNSGMSEKAGPIYGADVEGTLFTNQCTFLQWDLRKLDNHLNGLKPDIPGVSTPMLYVGSWCALFAYHVEDLDLYSINYLHYGAAKSWYSIEPDKRKRLESLAQCYFRQEYEFECKEFLRHKTKMISPNRLKSDGIEYQTVVQHAGEFVITFPGAYHAGFNHGFNIAEATNFALPRWFEIGRKAGICLCTPDTVRIDVDIVETRYLRELQRAKQKEQYGNYFNAERDQTHRIRCLCLARRSFTPTEENPIIVDETGRFTFFESFTSNKGTVTNYELRCCQTCALWFHTECVMTTFVDQECKFSCHVCQRIELEYCIPASNCKGSKKMMMLTPPVTVAGAKPPLPKKKQQVATKPQVSSAKQSGQALLSDFVDLTTPPASSSSSPSSSNNSQRIVKAATTTTATSAPKTVAEVGYRRNQLVRILLPRHAEATIGMLVSNEGQLGRLHVKGDPKANDIWVNLADCYVIDDPSSSTTTAYAPKKKDSKKRKPKVLGYEASMNKALRLSLMESNTTAARNDDSLYFDESEVFGDRSALGSIQADVKMEVDDGYGYGNNEHGDVHDGIEATIAETIPAIDLSPSPLPAAAAVLPHTISPAVPAVIDLTASDSSSEEEEEVNHFYDNHGHGLIPARVADLLR